MSKEKTMSESSKLYELGFHIVGTIDSNKVASVIDEIKSLITKHHGDIVREGQVKEMTLAYPMVKHVAGVNKKHSKSFFDWIKFTMKPEDVVKLKEVVDLHESVLRYILIKTVDDDEHSTAKLAELEDSSEEEVGEKEEDEPKQETVDEPEEKSRNKEIDEAIDEIVK